MVVAGFRVLAIVNSTAINIDVKIFFQIEVKITQSCLTLCDPHGLYSPWNSPGQNTGVGSLSLL